MRAGVFLNKDNTQGSPLPFARRHRPPSEEDIMAGKKRSEGTTLPSLYNSSPVLLCPVGGETLGYRKPWEAIQMYCCDCGWTYQFESYNAKPVASIKGQPRDHECGCPACEAKKELV